MEINPKIFISPPYIKCPKCGKNSYGVLMICDKHYCRRCNECFYPPPNILSIVPLPKLKKKVIYIDQFVISNMMKALNPKTKAYKKSNNELWVKVFEKLHTLSKLQLIICPDSHFHTNESLVTPYFDALKRMYELLSHGISFINNEDIKRFQINENANNWIEGKLNKQLNFDANTITHGNINAWQNRLIISVNINYGQDFIDELKNMQEKVKIEFKPISDRWSKEKNISFKDIYEEENKGFADTILQSYQIYANRLKQIHIRNSSITLNDILPTFSVLVIRDLRNIFEKHGIVKSEIWDKIQEYLYSTQFKNVPFSKISSMLFAAVARKFAAGRKKQFTNGLANDIEMISTLLPYCDAMFVDNECHGYLKEEPLHTEINYGTKIYSLNNIDELMAYLTGIENNAPKEHIDKISEVYGETWKIPYTTLYE